VLCVFISYRILARIFSLRMRSNLLEVFFGVFKTTGKYEPTLSFRFNCSFR
jgi:hypothetical protein